MPMPIFLDLYAPSAYHRRLTYVLDTLLADSGLGYRLHSSPERLAQAPEGSLRLSYGYLQEGLPFLPRHEQALRAGYLDFELPPEGEHLSLPCLYWQPENGALLPYDPFAAAFWLLARVEEYAPDAPANAHGIFPASASWLGRKGYLDRPLVQDWLLQGLQALGAAYGRELQPQWLGEVRFWQTYDIDLAYALKGRPLWRQGALLLRLLAQGQIGLLRRHGAYLLGQASDIYDNYALMAEQDEQAQAAGAQTAYFWLLADWQAPFDRCLPPQSKALQALIRQTAKRVERMGIHPSYQSQGDLERLSLEIQRLEDILEQPIRHSRQHYLRLRLPQTYRDLLQVGIHEDYSLGYAEQSGYRAGWSRPFFWYDLLAEQNTKLRLHPLNNMEVSLHKYLQLSPQAALEHIEANLQTLQQAGGGHFYQLWHNSSLGEQEGWQGWQAVYQAANPAVLRLKFKKN